MIKTKDKKKIFLGLLSLGIGLYSLYESNQNKKWTQIGLKSKSNWTQIGLKSGIKSNVPAVAALQALPAVPSEPAVPALPAVPAEPAVPALFIL